MQRVLLHRRHIHMYLHVCVGASNVLNTVCIDGIIFSLYLVGSARSMYADCLKHHIGKHWQQLAYHLGVNRTAVDSIALRHPSGLAMQVDDFLETVRFPDLGPYTLILILVALRAAGLDCVEDEVLREAVSRGGTLHLSTPWSLLYAVTVNILYAL